MAEKTEWRACEKGGVPKAVDSMHATAVIYRLCGAVDMMVPRETCARCPVPALVAKAALCDELAKAIRPGADAHRGDRHETPFQRLIDKYDELEAK